MEFLAAIGIVGGLAYCLEKLFHTLHLACDSIEGKKRDKKNGIDVSS